MISDTLFDAICDIDDYLTDPVFAGAYCGPLRDRILAVRGHMDDLRRELDTSPPNDGEGN